MAKIEITRQSKDYVFLMFDVLTLRGIKVGEIKKLIHKRLQFEIFKNPMSIEKELIEAFKEKESHHFAHFNYFSLQYKGDLVPFEKEDFYKNLEI